MLRQGPLDRRLGYLLRRAQLAVFQDFFATFAGFAVTPAQYAVLTLVEANPGSSQAQVADALAIKPANFVGLVRALVARGLVRRAAVPGDRSTPPPTRTRAASPTIWGRTSMRRCSSPSRGSAGCAAPERSTAARCRATAPTGRGLRAPRRPPASAAPATG
jgi:hypothetical protein